ncbi:hypothetical protein PCANC_07821 [Puccinia coronata f. sp. avenae]|uniref:Uncharacterized protein n=1 Tax=Puccinia coronata f. sp. avenae TaxID=200324 RepID=A0A2N5VC66_9BASI|nr:hypothetical protein PCANC_07821 [Puccinia coronata f. sp. avenae]
MGYPVLPIAVAPPHCPSQVWGQPVAYPQPVPVQPGILTSAPVGVMIDPQGLMVMRAPHYGMVPRTIPGSNAIPMNYYPGSPLPQTPPRNEVPLLQDAQNAVPAANSHRTHRQNMPSAVHDSGGERLYNKGKSLQAAEIDTRADEAPDQELTDKDVTKDRLEIISSFSQAQAVSQPPSSDNLDILNHPSKGGSPKLTKGRKTDFESYQQGLSSSSGLPMRKKAENIIESSINQASDGIVTKDQDLVCEKKGPGKINQLSKSADIPQDEIQNSKEEKENYSNLARSLSDQQLQVLWCNFHDHNLNNKVKNDDQTNISTTKATEGYPEDEIKSIIPETSTHLKMKPGERVYKKKSKKKGNNSKKTKSYIAAAITFPKTLGGSKGNPESSEGNEVEKLQNIYQKIDQDRDQKRERIEGENEKEENSIDPFIDHKEIKKEIEASSKIGVENQDNFSPVGLEQVQIMEVSKISSRKQKKKQKNQQKRLAEQSGLPLKNKNEEKETLSNSEPLKEIMTNSNNASENPSHSNVSTIFKNGGWFSQ